MNRLWQSFQQTSILFKIGFAVAVVVVLVLLMSGTGSLVSRYKDSKFDRQMESMKAERQALIDKADAAEEKAKALEADKIKYQLALEVAEKQGAKAQEKIADAQKKYDEEISNISADVDACTRYNLLRSKLGLQKVECPN